MRKRIAKKALKKISNYSSEQQKMALKKIGRHRFLLMGIKEAIRKASTSDRLVEGVCWTDMGDADPISDLNNMKEKLGEPGDPAIMRQIERSKKWLMDGEKTSQ